MKKLTLLAAATAVGLTTSAAYSQEAPAMAAAAANPKKTEARDETNSRAQTLVRVVDRGRIEIVKGAEEKGALPGVDPMTVASTSTVSAGKAALLKADRPGKGGKYHDIISRYASAYGVPAALAHAVVRLESNYRASARGRAGEIGLMQIKHSTARGMGYTGSAKGLYDPETNLKYGMKYLAQAHKLGGGNTCGTILRYNAGHGAKRMNPTSAAYCAKVKRLLGA